MATPDGHNTSFPNTIYQGVRDWAAKQEAFEKENNAPAPLNDVERAFLEDLRRPSPSPALLLDPSKDYVSLLCRQCWLTSFDMDMDLGMLTEII
jgi:hypothetical protein